MVLPPHQILPRETHYCLIPIYQTPHDANTLWIHTAQPYGPDPFSADFHALVALKAISQIAVINTLAGLTGNIGTWLAWVRIRFSVVKHRAASWRMETRRTDRLSTIKGDSIRRSIM
ncbi:hypothetical protein M011DRAFT_12066 [Sporormia fimetaria CBS 119925]|uniref:Uncharacterized protein n=1 Tax=Sporormia fimetaria CBS 119925 TaxID=1340428 RepID=A0A6A6VQ43_9PLEO|nr:hypothetical protein M011DRAFT_12066 [Sporormia fimetaria CBS 119925]